ncbi:hypothetical protein MKEN_01157200 [Mycena kentingensis (nom. inval.)]|nr:hypothetical protein MKEN_01157200 [Mycena kentingensis (nom. inval.)]
MKTRNKRAKKDTSLKAALDNVENAFATILPDGEPVNKLLDNEIECANEALEALTVLITPRGKGKAKSVLKVAPTKQRVPARPPAPSKARPSLSAGKLCLPAISLHSNSPAAPFPKMDPLTHNIIDSDSDESTGSHTESLYNLGSIIRERDIAFQDDSLGERDKNGEIRVVAYFWTSANKKPVKRELHIRFKTFFDLSTFPVASKVKLVSVAGVDAVVYERYSFADSEWKEDHL